MKTQLPMVNKIAAAELSLTQQIDNVEESMDRAAQIIASGARTAPKVINPNISVADIESHCVAQYEDGHNLIIELGELFDKHHALTRLGSQDEDHTMKQYTFFYDTTKAIYLPHIHPNVVSIKKESGIESVPCVLVPMWSSVNMWRSGLQPLYIVSIPLNEQRFQAMVNHFQVGHLTVVKFWRDVNHDFDPYITHSDDGLTRYGTDDEKLKKRAREIIEKRPDEPEWVSSTEVQMTEYNPVTNITLATAALVETAYPLATTGRQTSIQCYIEQFKRVFSPKKTVKSSVKL